MRIMLLVEQWDCDSFDLTTTEMPPIENAVKGVCHKTVSQYNIAKTVHTFETIKENEYNDEDGSQVTITRLIKRVEPNPFIEEWQTTGSHHTKHVDDKKNTVTLHKRVQEQQWFVDVADLKELLSLIETYVFRVEAGIDHGYQDVPLVAIL